MSIAKIFTLSTSKGEENKTFNGEVMENGNNCKNGNGTRSDNLVSNNDGGGSSNKATSGRRKFGENGFEEQGGYMAAKKAKLDNQFNNSARMFDLGGNSSDIFRGISIQVNGYTNPPEPELKEQFIRNGGTIHPYCTSRTNYVIATNLSGPSKRLYGSKTVLPDWIMESIAAKKLLDVRKYMLYDLLREKKQMTLTQAMGLRDRELSTVARSSSEAVAVSNRNGKTTQLANGSDQEDKCNEDANYESDEDDYIECTPEYNLQVNSRNLIQSISSIPNGHQKGKVVEKEKLTSPIEHSISGSSSEGAPITALNGNSHESLTLKSPRSETESPITSSSNSRSSSPSKESAQGKLKTATDEGFIEEFFGNSRLHLISEQKKEMQMFIGNLRKNLATHDFPNFTKFKVEIECSSNGHFADYNKVLMHVDLDCFFVSVGLLSRPHLRGKPIVVTHSSGRTQESKSDIACASYEARKFGISNGMWVGDAKAMCADVEVIPYDFEEYRRVSKLFFEITSSVTLDIEPNSVDEMVIDATSVLKNVPGSTPVGLAEFLRKIIFEGTGCPASVGIGSNRLLAKLAVKLAKPNGVHHLTDNDAAAYIAELDVRNLPGVGWSNEEKLREKFNAQTCGDLLRIPLGDLKSAFGEKTAEKMHSLCKGVDTTELKFGVDRPKSISVDTNFGIRFTKDEDVTTYLNNICKELSSRAERVQALSSHFTLKLLIRKKGAGMPLKHGGHGIVDSITRSRSLFNPTRNPQELYKTACSLIRTLSIPPSDYRGIGVTLSDLNFDCDKSNKRPVQRTLTEMPLSRAQKMLAMSKNMNKLQPITPSTTMPKEAAAPSEGEPVVDLTDNTPPSTTATSSSVSYSNGQPERKTVISFAADPKSGGINKRPPPDVDINVLKQLPREIAEEQCAFYGLDKSVLDQEEPQTGDTDKPTGSESTGSSYYDNIETIDQSFLLALPDNVRQDVLIQLQEAKGRRNVDIRESVQDEQPCSSKQAIERSKKLDDQRRTRIEKEKTEQKPEISTCLSAPNEKSEVICLEPMEEDFTLHHHHKGPIDPKKFWDITAEYRVLPVQSVTLPALNELTEVDEVRNLIREGLESLADPTSGDVEPLEKYFEELIANGWLTNTEVLLKFLRRQMLKLGNTSKWTSILRKIIDDTQKTCKRLYQGVLDLES